MIKCIATKRSRRLAPSLLAALLPLLLSTTQPAAAQTCTQARQLLEHGLSVEQVARELGVSAANVRACVAQKRPPGVRVPPPAGPAPHGAAGSAPHGAAGPAPHGAAGPAPHGAAGPAPHGAAGPAPSGSSDR